LPRLIQLATKRQHKCSQQKIKASRYFLQ
jgi:hypothetical protein